MKKRVCENCRFFQEAGFAKNGWCNNPQRKESSDVKLVVRRNELACRNGWAQDLWVLRTDDDVPADVVLHDTVIVRPMPPASVEEMTFLVNSQRDKQPLPEPPPPVIPPVDVVVGEIPSTKPVAAERQSLLAHDPRAAILKARERYRARMIAESRQGDVAKLLDDHVFRQSDGSEPQPPMAPIRRDLFPPISTSRPARVSDVPPVQISEVPRVFPMITSFPEDEVRFSSVPEPVEGVLLPRPEPKRRDNTALPVAAKADEGLVAAETLESSATTTIEAHVKVPIEPQPTRSRGHHRPQLQPEIHVEEPVPIAEDEPVLIEPVATFDRVDRRRFEFGGRRRGERVVATVIEPLPIEVEPEPELDEVVAAPAFDQEIVADVNPMIEIAPHVPRMCQTCRDFRPADAGGRGWCTNKWAFSHRRMVDADELPCETSVGCWWLPHDDVWMATADVSAHGQPTPLVDHWLAAKVGSATETGELRRRQRS